MILDELHQTKYELLVFAEEMMNLDHPLRKSDLPLLKSLKTFVQTIEMYMKEWEQETEIWEVDQWIDDGGYEEVFKKYTPVAAAWLAEFQEFFLEARELVPSFVPTEIDWGIYHKIRDGGLPGCPNFGVALKRAAEVLHIELETDEIYRRAAGVSSETR